MDDLCIVPSVTDPSNGQPSQTLRLATAVARLRLSVTSAEVEGATPGRPLDNRISSGETMGTLVDD